jgi:redox-sensitive bicupin YhaK (pirin superfamily)
MTYRSILHIASSSRHHVGPLSVAQPLPSDGLRYADPFVLLHHAGPQQFEASQAGARIDPHPHRGFSPVTFVYQGAVLHHDSLGNSSVVGPGEVQWIDAGNGIIHSEGPAPSMQEQGGALELIQLWVNVPASAKALPARYQELPSEKLVEHTFHGGRIRVVAGAVNGLHGPAQTFSDVAAAMLWLDQGAAFEWQAALPTCLVYVLGGSVHVWDGEDRRRIAAQHLVVLSEGSGVRLEAEEESRLLLLEATPLGEPMVAGGPFVMNTNREVYQAFVDYQEGKMGELT